eukprot:4010997-Heterocapsa_arctica.AAC.1
MRARVASIPPGGGVGSATVLANRLQLRLPECQTSCGTRQNRERRRPKCKRYRSSCVVGRQKQW